MKDEYWAEQVDIQRRGAEAWVMFAKGEQGRGASPRCARPRPCEDATDKSAVTPGPLAPARELLGYMLLENNQPKEALVEFEAVMKKEPNRFLAIYGAGKAAEATKQTAKAKGYFKQIVEMCKDAGTERPELQYARKMRAGRATDQRGSGRSRERDARRGDLARDPSSTRNATRTAP